MRNQIGTVNILRDRVYGDVYAYAGNYPVYREGDSIYWEMQGFESERTEPRFERIGAGLYEVYPPADRVIPSAPTVIKSHAFTLAEFRKFLSQDPACVDGSDRRLEFLLEESV